jgi:hypothetical protein
MKNKTSSCQKVILSFNEFVGFFIALIVLQAQIIMLNQALFTTNQTTLFSRYFELNKIIFGI